MSEVKCDGGPVTLKPWQRMNEQAAKLDAALSTIDGRIEESAIARTYIVAQIEALRWAAKLYDVG